MKGKWKRKSIILFFYFKTQYQTDTGASDMIQWYTDGLIKLISQNKIKEKKILNVINTTINDKFY